MNNLKVVALTNKLHRANAPLTVLEVIFLHPTNHLLKYMVHHVSNKIPMLLLNSSHEDSNTTHVVKLAIADQD